MPPGFSVLLHLSLNFFFVLRRAYPFGALRRPRGALTFLLLQKSKQKTGAREFHPLADPRTKVGCWTPPFGNPQVSLRYPDWPNSSPLRGWSFGAVGEGRERMRARHSRRTSTASGWGLTPPGPLRSPLGNICRSCANAHGTAFETAFAAMPSQISRKLLPRKRLGVPSLPSRGCAEGTLARPQGGIPKGAQPSLASLCLLSAGQKVGARRGLRSAPKG